MSNLTQKRLVSLTAEWQRILRLMDWRVAIRIARASDMDDDGFVGECWWEESVKAAKITILDPIDYGERIVDQDQEHTLIHELVHLHFAAFMSLDRESPECIAQEIAVDMIAGALLELKREIDRLKGELKMAKKKGGIHINPANKGKLHEELGVAPGKKIPAKKLAKAVNSSNPAEKKRAVFAENAKKWNHKGKKGK